MPPKSKKSKADNLEIVRGKKRRLEDNAVVQRSELRVWNETI